MKTVRDYSQIKPHNIRPVKRTILKDILTGTIIFAAMASTIIVTGDLTPTEIINWLTSL